MQGELYAVSVRGCISLYWTMTKHPCLPGAWITLQTPSLIIKSTRTSKEFTVKELSGHTTALCCRMEYSPSGGAPPSAQPVGESQQPNILDQWCFSFVFVLPQVECMHVQSTPVSNILHTYIFSQGSGNSFKIVQKRNRTFPLSNEINCTLSNLNFSHFPSLSPKNFYGVPFLLHSIQTNTHISRSQNFCRFFGCC